MPPRRRLAKARAELSVAGTHIYNCVSEDIKSLKSDVLFKNKLKTMLIERACYSVNEFLQKDS